MIIITLTFVSRVTCRAKCSEGEATLALSSKRCIACKPLLRCHASNQSIYQSGVRRVLVPEIPEASEDDDPDFLLVFGRELISNCKPVDGRICDLFVVVVAKIEPYVLRSNYLDKWNRSGARLSCMEDATSFV